MILGDMVGTAAESPGSNAAGQELRTLLKTAGDGRGAARAGSHAGSHTDEQPSDASDPVVQPGETSPRSRTDLNGFGCPYGYLRIRRLGVRVPPSAPGRRPLAITAGGNDQSRTRLNSTVPPENLASS